MRTEPGGHVRRAKGRPLKIGGAQERLSGLVKARNKEVVPERVEVGAPLVEHLGQVGVQVLCVEAVLAIGGVVFADVERREHAVDVLHVGDVAAETDDGGVGEGAETFYVGEAGQGAVGGWTCQYIWVYSVARLTQME